MEHDCERIRENLVFLNENTTNVNKLLLHLLQENILQKSYNDEIIAERGQENQTRMLYSRLMEKGTWAKEPLTYKVFRKILLETGNEHIVEKLDLWKPKGSMKSTKKSNDLQEIAKSLKNLHPLEMKQLNVLMAKDDSNNIPFLSGSVGSTEGSENNNVNKKDGSSQTDENETTTVQKNDSKAKVEKDCHYAHNSYLLHDIKLTENPLTCPTSIGQLVMYHAEMEGSTFRKFLKYIRGLHTFKYFSFSPGGEIALLDLDLLHDSHLVDVTFKNVNLFFDGREVKTLKTVTRLQLWMCTMEEDFFQTLSMYFPVLEYIEICGCVFGNEGGVKASDLETMFSVPHLKEIFIQPWTNPAFNGDVSAIMESVEAPNNPWSVFIQRDQSYKWKFVGREKKKKL